MLATEYSGTPISAIKIPGRFRIKKMIHPKDAASHDLAWYNPRKYSRKHNSRMCSRK